MPQHNSFVFWDDMWNENSKKQIKEETKLTDECCGQWDEFGQCACKK